MLKDTLLPFVMTQLRHVCAMSGIIRCFRYAPVSRHVCIYIYRYLCICIFFLNLCMGIYLIYVCHLCELSIKNSSQSVSSFRTYSTDAFAFGWLRCAWLEEKSMYDKWRLEDSQPLQSTIIFLSVILVMIMY